MNDDNIHCMCKIIMIGDYWWFIYCDWWMMIIFIAYVKLLELMIDYWWW
jgi:hypothetical protein